MEWLKLMRPQTVMALVAEWEANKPLKGTSRERNSPPIAKLFNPLGGQTWLLTELEPNSSLAFGLCDLSMGTPECGYVDLEELWDLRLPGGVKIEEDLYFKATKTLREYADESRQLGYINA